ncbi:hypothetical protein EGH25_06150 [Haladaptatus sp. F3-133]|uniref:Uncharacterized protein n=1 Tax=Halorutilus salinus TaxID=2487751 RepID=A0A9Q4GHM1_9EURY|nr:hypothetical protein [Halorutilus salinus]MCX2818930.1 hypothetical protein [Halorutilus salinus]
MRTRRSFLAVSAASLTGCLGGDGGKETNESDEDEPEYAVTTSKNTLEPPRDSLEVVVENREESEITIPPSIEVYKDTDEGKYLVTPYIGRIEKFQERLGGPVLEPNGEHSWTFVVDNTDPDSRGRERYKHTLWGLNPGTYTAKVGYGVSEFKIEGDPVDRDKISYEIKQEDGVTEVYYEEHSLEDEVPAVRLTPTDEEGRTVIEEQLNQLGGLRDAVLYADGGEAVVYTDEESLVGQLRVLTDIYPTEGAVIEYENETYRARYVE